MISAPVSRPAKSLIHRVAAWVRGGFGGVILILTTVSVCAQSGSATFDDHQNMMDQLGVKKLRPGPNPNDQSTFDEAIANPYTNSLPDALTMKDGTKVTRPEQWPARRAEIEEDFEREVYGRIPVNVPKVTWQITATSTGTNGGNPTITRTLVGHVDNSRYTNIVVNIQASFTVPANATAPVPVMIEFGGGFGFGGPRGRGVATLNSSNNVPGTNTVAITPGSRGAFGGRGGEPLWHKLAITNGWGYGSINPGSIQGDNNHLTSGIIGLVNRGQPRKPDDWGALRAWQWGVSQLIDYFEANPDSMVDATKVGIEGLSRYGKAAIVTEAFEPRIAVGLIGSSGEGGVKLHRHIFGEAVENLAGGEYYWMAGNFIKYGAAEPLKTAADLPVDAHELIAMCAPRPCFISYGIVEHGDAKWVDAHGSFMAGVLAGPVYRLLGKKDFGTPGDYLTDVMPPVNQLIGGELAWRQHDGGHDVTPNWPAFFNWVGAYIKAPPLPVISRTPDVPVLEPLAAAPAAPAWARPNTAIIPSLFPGFMKPHTNFVERAKQGDIDVLFMGDSITDWWRNPGMGAEINGAIPYGGKTVFEQHFGSMKVANFGIAGDTTQGVLWRLQNGEGQGYQPKAVMLMIGTNNTGRNSPPEIALGIAEIVFELRKDFPDAKILLLAVFPRGGPTSKVRAEIDGINRLISALNDNQHVFYLDIGSKFLAADGSIPRDIMSDGLHPTSKGYEIWAEAVHDTLLNFLQ
jgi:lysophospholipase L1-like esterase